MNILAILPDPNSKDPQKCVNDTGCGFTPCVCNPSKHPFKPGINPNFCCFCGAPENYHDDEELRELIADFVENAAESRREP